MSLQSDRNTTHTTNGELNGHVQLHQNNSPADGGKLIVITAPLTESIDHAGYFIQMGMASMPIWMEGVLNSKYPKWRDVEKQRRRFCKVHACRCAAR